jgi:2'-5' RNA ligase
MRTFIAIPAPSTRPLEAILKLLSSWQPALRPVAPDKLHLTLKFLGETEESQIPKLTEILLEAAASERQQSVTYRGLGTFPRIERPTVVWTGLAEPTPWVRVADLLARRCEELGFPREERPFQPHVTLARVKSRPPEKLADLVQDQLTAELGQATFTSLALFRSDLLPAGPEYTCLCEAQFRTENHGR